MTWIPEAASNLAGKVDGVILVITLISIFFFVLISAVLIYFAVKYRRKREDEETPYITGNEPLEIIWTVIPSILLILLFIYGFVVYKDMRTPPKDAVDITVTGKQWIWNFDYYNGKKTLNELYVKQNVPVRMIMRADDVLHSFFIPQFRVKQDILPGRYTQLWFTPTKVGTFDLFCAEYCGTGHSQMLGKVIVLSPEAYDIWEKGIGVDDGGAVSSLPPAEFGEKLYTNKGCNACHSLDGSVVIGPSFKALYGRTGTLEDGSTYTADENYIIKSIYEPQEEMVQGFQPVMPSFKGILSEQEVDALIAYIKTLK